MREYRCSGVSTISATGEAYRLPPHRHRRWGREQGGGHFVPAKNLKKYFSGKYHVKFGHFVNFSYTDFGSKMSCTQKLIELLRL